MTELPDTWKWSTIGEVADIVRGVTYSKGDTLSATDSDAVPLLRATNLEVDSIDFEDMVYVPKRVVKAQQYLQLDDIFLAASSGSISVVGKSAQVVKTNGETFGAFCAVIRPKHINPKFLAYWVQSPTIRDHWSATAKGTNINNLKPSDISETNIPVPSIDEQHEIVEILEGHLSRLDAGLVDVKQAKLQATQFKVAFLRKVFSGDATWNSIPMKQLGKWGGGGTPSKSNEKFWTNGTVPWLSPKDMGPLEITATEDKITEEACLNSTVKKIPENSVVFVVRSGILERKLPIALTKVETTLNQDMKALTFSEIVNPKFGFYAMLSFEQDILKACRKSGTTVASINTESLMNYEIKIPSLPIQEEILNHVESQLTLIDNSLPQIDSALKVGNSLRRSLLKAAFTGQLTNEVVSV